ncbi:hypothetical protein HF078_12535 [Bacillus sp. RO2]|uniref:hypothetical protein n=1 Tax=Bacillus sp. RO2 TaxID=2723913 RepID=UPI00145E3467|nr:hypothetical protein [Bacillus sp. RO2]NMH73911.1 hypothetical protein [Bacillus sp. RO2]
MNNGVPGETEKDKQVNTLTPDRLENQENRAFFIATSPEDRWVLSKKNVSSDNFAGYTLTFKSNKVFEKDRDQELQSRHRYSLYTLENINGLTVLLEAYTKGILTDVHDEIDSNNYILETSTIKNYLGYWHYKEMNQYFEITFDEFGGMIHESTGYGYSFTITNETNNEIELALGTGETWKVTKDGDSLLVGKSDGYDMTLHTATKDE